MRRWLLGILLGLALVTAAVLAVAVSPWARDQVLALVLDQVADSWTLERSSGSLFRQLQLDGLELTSGDTRVQLSQLQLSWQPWALLDSTLEVSRLQLTDLQLTLPPATPPAEAAGPPQLPAAPDLPLANARLSLVLTNTVLRNADGSTLLVLDHAAAVMLLDQQQLRVRELSLGAAQGTINGSAELDLVSGYPLVVDLQVNGQVDTTPVAGRIKASGPLLLLDTKVSLQAPAAAELQARMDLRGAEPSLDGQAQWQLLPVPETAAPLAIKAGTAQLQGSASQLTASLATRLNLGVEDLQVQAQLAWDGTTLTINQAQLTPAAGQSLQASAELNTNTGAFLLALDSQGLEPVSLLPVPAALPAWPAAVKLQGNFQGNLGSLLPTSQGNNLGGNQNGSQQPATLTQARLSTSMEWLGQQLTVTGNGSWDGHRGTLGQLSLTSADNTLQASGTLVQPGLETSTSRTKLQLTLALGNLAGLWPDLEGSVTGSATLGTLAFPGPAELALEANNLRWQDLRISRISITGATGLQQDAHLQLTAKDIRSGDQQLDEVTLEHQLRNGNHSLTVVANSAWGQLSSSLAGSLSGEQVNGEVHTLHLLNTPAGNWQLAKPSSYQLDSSSFALDSPLCLQQADGPGSLCLDQMSVANNQPQLAATLTSLPMTLAQPFLPAGLTLSGAVAGQIRYGADQLDVSLDHSGGKLVAESADNIRYETELRQLQLRLQANNSLFNVDASADLGRAGGLNLSLTADRTAATSSLPLSGQLRLQLQELELLSALVPAISHANGTLTGDLRLLGATSAPIVDGTLQLQMDTLVVPPLAAITNLTLTLAGNPQGVLSLSGGAVAAEGSLKLEGNLGPYRDGVLPASIRLSGSNWPALDQDTLAMTVSPDLQGVWDGSDLRLTGKILIPAANIRFEQVSSNDVTLSDDVIIHRKDGADSQAAVPLYADVTVSAGDAVHLGGAGLKLQLGGALRVRSQPGRPLQATGSVRTIAGSYKAYGQDLTIYQGRLDFAGPVDNPTVNIRAGRSLLDPEVEVGFQLSGFLRDMQAKLYSQPAMADADALAFLVAGRSLAGSSTPQARMVNDAAVKLGVAAAAPITAAVRKRLGIDELGVENPTDPETGAVMVGKQLTDDLYVRYSYGLFNRGGGLLLRYRLSDSLSLQTEAGTTRAVDLLYRVDFDSFEQLFGEDKDPSPRDVRAANRSP